ncbi:hypothetical protein ABIF35_005314 [Bradyrhizobium japonicum]
MLARQRRRCRTFGLDHDLVEFDRLVQSPYLPGPYRPRLDLLGDKPLRRGTDQNAAGRCHLFEPGRKVNRLAICSVVRPIVLSDNPDQHLSRIDADAQRRTCNALHIMAGNGCSLHLEGGKART